MVASYQVLPPWGYCCECEETHSLEFYRSGEEGGTVRLRQLWYLHMFFRGSFLQTIPSVDLLSKLNMQPHRAHGSYRLFFNHFVGYCDLRMFLPKLKELGIRVYDREWPRVHSSTFAFLIPVQKTPGYITGMAVISEDRSEILKFKHYDPDTDLFYLRLHPYARTDEFSSLEEGCARGQWITQKHRTRSIVARPVLDPNGLVLPETAHLAGFARRSGGRLRSNLL